MHLQDFISSSFFYEQQEEDDEVGKGKGFARISSFITNMTFCRNDHPRNPLTPTNRVMQFHIWIYV